MDNDEINQDHIPEDVLELIGGGGGHSNGPDEHDAQAAQPGVHVVSDAEHIDQSGPEEVNVDVLVAPNQAGEGEGRDGVRVDTSELRISETRPTEEQDGAGEEPARKRRRKGKASELPLRASTRTRKAPNSTGVMHAGLTGDVGSGSGSGDQNGLGGMDLSTSAANKPLSNKEQLHVLREAYNKNPTPSKAELMELGRATDRHWLKVKEYFRQRRNKLRGVDEVDNMLEPERAVSWLHMSYRSALNPVRSVSQLELYQAYKTKFDVYNKFTPLLGGSDLIQLTCATFPFCSMAKDDSGPGGTTEWLLKGIRKRKLDEEEGELAGQGESSQQAQSAAEELQSFVVGMPEPLRAGTWLLQDYQDAQMLNRSDSSYSQSHITQAEFYAHYAGRFGQVNRLDVQQIGLGSMGSSQTQGPGHGQAEGVSDLMSSVIPIAPDDLGGLQVGPSSSMLPRDEAVSTRSPHEGESGDEEGNDQDYEYKSNSTSRLLTPLELIQLARMTFKNAVPTVDEQGSYIISGLEKRQGTSRFRPKDVGGNAMFPFGLLDVPTSSPVPPFTSLIKRKLDVIEVESALTPPPAPPPQLGSQHVLTVAEQYATGNIHVSDEQQAIFDMMMAGTETANPVEQEYNEPLAEHDREMLDGLRRFGNSRLGREAKAACVSQ